MAINENPNIPGTPLGHPPAKISSRPRYPYLPDNSGELEYDKFRNPDTTPGHSAVAVVNPDGSDVVGNPELMSLLGEMLLTLRLQLRLMEIQFKKEVTTRDLD